MPTLEFACQMTNAIRMFLPMPLKQPRVATPGPPWAWPMLPIAESDRKDEAVSHTIVDHFTGVFTGHGSAH
jgi:hypothetical protein